MSALTLPTRERAELERLACRTDDVDQLRRVHALRAPADEMGASALGRKRLVGAAIWRPNWASTTGCCRRPARSGTWSRCCAGCSRGSASWQLKGRVLRNEPTPDLDASLKRDLDRLGAMNPR
ncbi:MAG: hypothetical protein U0790_29480 [Isosphaeraceae bacterium]